jgi:hypothetical protein
VRARLLAAAAAATVLAGCGSDPRPPKPAEARAIVAPVQLYLANLYSGEFSVACDQLDSAAQDGVVDYLNDAIPHPHAANCREALALFLKFGSLDTAAAGVMDKRRRMRWWKAPVEAVEIEGDEATARANRSRKLVHLERDGHDWKIHSLDFSDVAK